MRSLNLPEASWRRPLQGRQGLFRETRRSSEDASLMHQLVLSLGQQSSEQCSYDHHFPDEMPAAQRG